MKEPKDFHRLKISNAFITVLTSGSLYISLLKHIIHGMRTTEKVRCWNSQTVWKAEASTVNTIRISIKTVRESVNPCIMVEIP